MTAETTRTASEAGRAGPSDPPPAPYPRRWVAMVVLILAFTLDLLNVTIVNVALPAIQRDLGADPTELEWISAAYLLAFAAALITFARLGDLWGRKRMFLAGLAGFAVTGLWSGLAGSPAELIAARAGQGLAAAAVAPQVLSVMYVMFQGRERATVLGLFGFVSCIAQAGGLLVGGAVITGDLAGLGWRAVFLVSLPIAVGLLVAGAALVPESRSPGSARPRWVAAGALSVGLVAIVFPLLEGRRYGWPAWCWAGLAAGIMVVAGVAYAEHRREAWRTGAMLPAALFGNRTIAAGLGVQLLAFAGFSGFLLVLALWLQDGQGFSPLDAGLVTIAYTIGALPVTPFVGRLTVRFGRFVVLAGCVVSALGGLGILLAGHASPSGVSSWSLVPGLLLLGAGNNLVMPPLTTLVLSAAPPEHAGSASGIWNTGTQFGAALGVAVLGTIFFAGLDSGGYPAALGASQLTIVGTLAAAAVLCLALTPRARTA